MPIRPPVQFCIPLPACIDKGKPVGQKLPLKLKEIWAIRVRLQLATNRRDLALFNLANDSKLRSSDLVKLKVSDISNAVVVSARVMVLQQKKGKPVQLGGNLQMVATSIGVRTPSMVGTILFLEYHKMGLGTIDRDLTQLLRSGAPYGIVGVVLGSFESARNHYGR